MPGHRCPPPAEPLLRLAISQTALERPGRWGGADEVLTVDGHLADELGQRASSEVEAEGGRSGSASRFWQQRKTKGLMV